MAGILLEGDHVTDEERAAHACALAAKELGAHGGFTIRVPAQDVSIARGVYNGSHLARGCMRTNVSKGVLASSPRDAPCRHSEAP